MSDQDPDVLTVARLFQRLGAEPQQAEVMAAQLVKRAGQLAAERGISKLEATESLIRQVIAARQGDGSGSDTASGG